MPDPQTDDTQPVQQQGGMINGGHAGITGGTGFFGNLVATLVRGAVQGGVAELGQNQGTPGARAMAAGVNAQQVQQQKQKQESAEQDEATLRKQRIALTQVQYLQAKHALGQADEATQKAAHDHMAGWFDHLYQEDNAEIHGGTSDNQADLQQSLQDAKKQFPDDLSVIAPVGYSNSEHPTYAVFHVKNNSMEKAFDWKLPGHEEAGIPPMTGTVPAKTNATDGSSLVISNGRKALVENETSKLAPRDGLDAPQESPEQVKAYMRSIKIPVPDNFDDVFAVAQGQEPKKELPTKSVRNGKVFEVGKDRATDYIHNFSPGYKPDQMAKAAEFRKALDKVEGNYAEENGKLAAQAIETAKGIVENKGGGSPELVQRAQRVIDKAKPFAAKYQQEVNAKAATKENKDDFKENQILFNQRMTEGQDQNGRKLTLEEASDTQPIDAYGNPIPLKLVSAYKPGQMQQQTAATAVTLLATLDRIEKVVQAHPTYIGPIGGSVGELKAHYGLGTKEAQSLYDDLLTAQSGFTKMHTSRFSKEILDKATTMLNAKMNSGQAMGAIQSMRNTAQLYEKDDKLMSKADYLRAQQETKERMLTKMQGYLQKVGWQGGKPTDQQKQAAQQLAKSEGQNF
jgi:hypothetical protein